jgi:hypothetical protein
MTGSNQTETKTPPDLVDEKGPWPFVTRRVFRSGDGSEQVWSSRHHRKGLLVRADADAEGLASKLLRCLWMPRQLNWWIGAVFAVGSLLFALASVLSLAPALARAWSLDSTAINAIFFAGSIPFTIAAYLQLFQAANAGEFLANHLRSGQRLHVFGWRPGDIGWLSCALQFVGTILFNINTFDAMLPSLDWLQQDLLIWAPDFVGSILFLASGYLAFIETCHAHWAWKPASLSWWVVFTNLLGCVGFMIAAVFAIVLPGTSNTEAVTLSVLFTLFGAIGFLVGSLLMLPETVSGKGSRS